VKRFIEGQDREQLILLPECLDDYVGEDNPVRVVEAFIDELDLGALGFSGVVPPPVAHRTIPLRYSRFISTAI
jgi:transposase